MNGDLPSHIEREKPAAQSLYDRDASPLGL
jgi:hypothetical protein